MAVERNEEFSRRAAKECSPRRKPWGKSWNLCKPRRGERNGGWPTIDFVGKPNENGYSTLHVNLRNVGAKPRTAPFEKLEDFRSEQLLARIVEERRLERADESGPVTLPD